MNYNFYPQNFFPSPQGNIYLLQSSAELQNVPATQGVNAALCIAENTLYLKSLQNGTPSLLTYKLTQEAPDPSPDMDARLKRIEEEINKLKGVNSNDFIF